MQYDMYDNQKINEIANTLDIAQYIRSTGEEPERRNGENLFFRCKNTNEDHASLAVDTEKNYYHCFSCNNGKGGNLLAYLVNEEHMPFPRAAEKILALAHVSPNDATVTEQSETVKYLQRLKNESEKKPRPMLRVYQSYDDYDKLSKTPSSTWEKEGIKGDTQRRFDIRTSAQRNEIYYPIFEPSGRFVCAKIRKDLPQDILKKLGIPKYKYSSKISGVDFLSGLKFNVDEIKAKNEVVVFEGYKSVMLAYQMGFGNSVCAETCNLTEDQVRLLISLKIKNVVIAFDQDRSFEKVKSSLWILPRFTNVSIVIDRQGLLKPKDSPVDEGKAVWQKLYEGRIGIN